MPEGVQQGGGGMGLGGTFIVSEARGSRSRSSIVLAAQAAALPAGMVLAKNTITEEYDPWDPLGADGIEIADAVLYWPQPVSVVARRVAVVFNACEVNGEELVYTANGAADKPKAKRHLRARGIIVVDGA